MFEFEFPGTIVELEQMERDLVEYLGLGGCTAKDYSEWVNHYNIPGEIEDEHEYKMFNDFGACMIKNFPESTSPFWNMSRNEDGNTSKKIDVILGGMETIGSAERATDVQEMRDQFHNISDGEYAQLLYNHFGKKRVEDELEEYLALDMFERFLSLT